ncbi:MAG: phosphoglycerate kinase [Candidatus Marinimicrobia bacterium]|nr:phosphoglycerate kinase [Candidatus Neomarinimicrobiota bacterium]
MKRINEINISNKKVLIRVDFNVPIENNQILSDFRILAVKKTIDYCLEKNSSIVLMSHLGRPNGFDSKLSLNPIYSYLKKIYPNYGIYFSKDCISDKSVNVSNRLKAKEIHLLENLRYYNEELEDDVEFSKKLSLHGDVYVNDAFGTSHRQHASNSSILRYFNNKAIGFLMDKEINYLSKILDTDISPCVLILGGAKISTKLKMLNHFINRTSNILIGGAMAFTFLKAKGYNVGKSLVEEHMISEAENVIKNCENNNIQLSLPVDFVCSKEFSNTSEYLIKKYSQIDSDYMGLDIGGRTIELYSKILEIAKTVIWNGPMGAFEMSNFSKGTYDIANKLGNLYGRTHFTSIVGGGDTMRAIIDCGIENQYNHISTGGGASLSLLSGDELKLYSIWRKYET